MFCSFLPLDVTSYEGIGYVQKRAQTIASVIFRHMTRPHIAAPMYGHRRMVHTLEIQSSNMHSEVWLRLYAP